MNAIDLRRIDLNLLIVFQALMQESNVTRAAMKLSLSQSAVSAALSRLRKLFNDRLFERTRTGMIPTKRALEISAKLAPTLTSIAEVVFEEPEFVPTESKKMIHLAMSDDVELVLAPWLAARKIERGWGVDFAIHQTNSARWRESLETGRADMALTLLTAQPPSAYQSETLFSAGYLCVFNPSILKVSDPIVFAEFVAADHVRVSYDVQRGWVDELMAAKGYERRTVSAISHFAGLVPILDSIPSIATIPAYAAEALAGCTGLTTSPVPLEPPHFTISAVWDARLDGSPENVWVRRVLAEFVAAMER